MNYVFSYGSNLDINQMKSRCKSTQIIGKAILENYYLCFPIYSRKRECNVASIKERNGDIVKGVIYSIDDNDLKKLDKYEAINVRYVRIEKEFLINNELIKAFVYIHCCEESIGEPSQEYLKHINEGYKYHEL